MPVLEIDLWRKSHMPKVCKMVCSVCRWSVLKMAELYVFVISGDRLYTLP